MEEPNAPPLAAPPPNRPPDCWLPFCCTPPPKGLAAEDPKPPPVLGVPPNALFVLFVVEGEVNDGDAPKADVLAAGEDPKASKGVSN